MNNLKNIICAALIGGFSTFLPFWQWGGSGRQLFAAAMTTMIVYGMAKGRVENKFKQMHRNVTGVVGFVNILDVYEYLGAAEISIQNQFGFQYMKDFMGFNTIFLLSDSEIPRGQVIATPVENIVLYYVDPNESDFARAGLVYTVSGETNLIGFHTQGNYHTAVSEAFAVMGLTKFLLMLIRSMQIPHQTCSQRCRRL